MSSRNIQHTLSKHHELRIEVSHQKVIYVTLLHGEAEIFGSILNRGEKYSFSGQKFAIIAYVESSISIEGQPDIIYCSDESSVPTYLKIHEIIEQRRTLANEAGIGGPRVAVAGPENSGKSTIVRTLCNLAVRMRWTPIIVDLDTTQGTLSVPGCISATILDRTFDIEEGFSLKSPLVYYFGHAAPSQALEHYKVLAERVASVVKKHHDCNKKLGSGIYVDTMSYLDAKGFALLLHQIETFTIDLIIVIGQDKLYSKLLAHAKQVKGFRKIDIIKIPQSGGVVVRNTCDRKRECQCRVQKYFNGVQNTLEFEVNTAAMSSFNIYSIGGNTAPLSTLPIGALQLHAPFKVVSRNISKALRGRLLAVSHALTSAEVLNSNVAGFIQILEVDDKTQLVTYRAPSINKIPSGLLIL